MSTTKEDIINMLEKLPDDATAEHVLETMEDVLDYLYVRRKIEKGLRDSAEGRVLSQEEVEKRLEKWRS